MFFDQFLTKFCRIFTLLWRFSSKKRTFRPLCINYEPAIWSRLKFSLIRDLGKPFRPKIGGFKTFFNLPNSSTCTVFNNFLTYQNKFVVTLSFLLIRAHISIGKLCAFFIFFIFHYKFSTFILSVLLRHFD